MSLTNKATVNCPQCSEPLEVSWAGSVNGGRHSALRDAILDETFQVETCPSCEAKFRLPSHVSYLDIGRKHWILAEDVPELPNWAQHETKAKALFDETFGAKAPKPAQELAEGVQPRLVFGWQGLREKLICTELSLDDVYLELLKMAMLISSENTQIGDNIALRLYSGDEANLKFNIVESQTEKIVSTADVPRSAYDAIVNDDAAWQPLLQELSGKTFVDVARLMIAA